MAANPKINVLVVARWFIDRAAAADAELSNMKLQKLLYYAQGRYLARTGSPLFGADIEAWNHGPVVARVYGECKASGNGPIRIDLSTWPAGKVDRVAEQILSAVWVEEGSLAAWKLRQMTHQEPPWKDAYDGTPRKVIPVSAIHEHFVAQHAAPDLSIEDAFAEWADESLELAEEFLPAACAAEWQ